MVVDILFPKSTKPTTFVEGEYYTTTFDSPNQY